MSHDIHFPDAAHNLINAIFEDGGFAPKRFDLKRLRQHVAALPIEDWRNLSCFRKVYYLKSNSVVPCRIG